MFRQILQAVDAALLPHAANCLVCEDPRRADDKYCLCPDCRAQLLKLRLTEGLCPRCMTPMNGRGECRYCKTGGMEGLRAGYGAYVYAPPANTLVKALKFGYTDEAAEALCAFLPMVFPAQEYDALVPVPLHPARQRLRGINQAELICRLTGPRVGLPILPLLRRVRNTRPQARMDATHRAGNLRGAFVADPAAEGLRLLLVDDVRTTGATARACADVLTAAGAKYVSILTPCIAVRE